MIGIIKETSQQNGVIEKVNRTLLEQDVWRVMLGYLRIFGLTNRSPCSTSNFKIIKERMIE